MDFKGIFKSYLSSLIDELNKFLFIILVIMFVISLFISNFFVDLSKFILLFIIIFRLLSKNKVMRNKENKVFLSIIDFLLKPFNNIIRNFKDRKKFVYKKCRKCKTTLKLPLPSKRGIMHAKCPNCGNRVGMFLLRKEKIVVDVIKKRK